MLLKNKSRIVALFPASLTVSLTVLLAATSIGISSAFASATITWTAGDAKGSSCASIQSDPDLNPGPGQQAWLFTLSQPSGDGPYELTTTFSPAWQTPDNAITGFFPVGGDGSVHFIVNSIEGAQLISASASGGQTGQSVLTIAHCEVHPALPLVVLKTAQTSLRRTYSVNAAQAGFTDSNWQVSGAVTIANNNAIPVTVTGLTDEISPDGIAITLNCPSAIAPLGTVSCQYGPISLLDGSVRTTTTTVTAAAPVPAGLPGKANIDFSQATITGE